MPRSKEYEPTPPRDEFIPADLRSAQKTIDLLINEASSVGYPSRRQQPQTTPTHHVRLRWSPSFWSISKPFLTDHDTVAYNRYQETSVCSSTPLVDECTVRILEDCHCALGVGVIERGRVTTLWKYENDGTRFGYHTARDGTCAKRIDGMLSPVPYGEPYSEGDLITVNIADGVLSFKKNGKELGPCFTLPEGTFYLRGYMCGLQCVPGMLGGGKLEIVATCERCANEGRLRCPCGDVAYCSKECQKKRWKTHKVTCNAKGGVKCDC